MGEKKAYLGSSGDFVEDASDSSEEVLVIPLLADPELFILSGCSIFLSTIFLVAHFLYYSFPSVHARTCCFTGRRSVTASRKTLCLPLVFFPPRLEQDESWKKVSAPACGLPLLAQNTLTPFLILTCGRAFFFRRRSCPRLNSASKKRETKESKYQRYFLPC